MTDPLTRAEHRLSEAQAAYDAARTAGRPLTAGARRGLAVRLAEARADFRAAVHGYAPAGDEADGLEAALQIRHRDTCHRCKIHYPQNTLMKD